jgi:hypothetical protein
MAQLANFPMQDQLTEPTEDGRASENKRFNCVAVSTASGARWLTGVWHSGDRLKDGVYGEAYANAGTAERSYIDFVAKLYEPRHVLIQRRGAANPEALIQAIRAEVKAGHPTVITMPSAWNTPPSDPMHPGSSHVGCVYQIDDDDSGYMTVMNPWGGFAHRRLIVSRRNSAGAISELGWREVLCYNECWPMSVSGGVPTMLELAQVSNFLHASGDGWARNDRPDVLIRGGLLTAYRSYPSIGALFGFSEFGLPLALEEVCRDAKGAVVPNAWRIVCERGVLVVDGAHAYDDVPGVPGGVYRGHITAADAPLYGAVINPPISAQDAKILAAARAGKGAFAAMVAALG